jgi:hypothetical protein
MIGRKDGRGLDAGSLHPHPPHFRRSISWKGGACMSGIRHFVASALLALGISSAGHAQSPPERWVPTWAAPDVARVDQPAGTLAASAQAFPWINDVPAAVREAAPNQQLEVSGGSRLHFRSPTSPSVERASESS